MSCNITGTLYTPDGSVLANSGVLFEVLTDGAARTAVHVPYKVQSFFTTDDTGLLDADIETPSSGSWQYRMTIHENGATYDFYLASTATALTIDEVLALAGQSGSEAGTPQGEFLNGLYTAVSGAADGKMLETLGGDLTLVDAPEGMPEPSSDGLWARFVASAVGSWLQATTVGAALFAAVDAAAGRAALGAAASAGSGTAGELMVSDADGNSVRAGYTASQSASANTVARRTSDGGIAAIGNNAAGVDGRSTHHVGVYGESAATSGSGVSGYSPTTGTGVTGVSASGSGGQSTSMGGTYHHRFGTKSAIDRLSGILKFVDSTAASDRAAQRTELGLGSAALLTAGGAGTSLVEAASVDAARAALGLAVAALPPRRIMHHTLTWSATDTVGSPSTGQLAGGMFDLRSGATANGQSRYRVNDDRIAIGRTYIGGFASWSRRVEIQTHVTSIIGNAQGVFRGIFGKGQAAGFGLVASGNYVGWTVENDTLTTGIVCKAGTITSVALTPTASSSPIGLSISIISENGAVNWYANGVLVGTTTAGPVADNSQGTYNYEINNGATAANYIIQFWSQSEGY